jgi:uncharacterized protein (DUF362 family)
MAMKRREFLESSAAFLAAVGTARGLARGAAVEDRPAIAAIEGGSVSRMLDRAFEGFGGMASFVRLGDKVVLLPNPQGSRPGVSTNPELIGELVRRSLEAGASEAVVASVHGPGRWYATGIIEAVEKAGGKVHYPQAARDWIDAPVPRGERLKKSRIIRKAVENDVFIDVPIVKQHDSTRITCTMKNLMGLSADSGSFHRSDDYLEHAIADLASLFAPKLCAVDAMTILTQNGPFGPGRTISPRKIILGKNMVTVDAYCCRLLELDPREVGHIRIAAGIGLGEINVSGLKILEARV